MELLKDLELVEVAIDDGKAVLTFLDEEHGEIREVNFNKKIYDSDKNKWVEDAAKAEKVEKRSKEYFNLSFDELGKAVGERHNIYAYEKFNSLWEVEQIEKFDKEMLGQIIETQIKEIEDDGKAIRVKFEYEGKLYESKMSYADYMETRKQWFVNPQKKTKQFAKFESKFHVPFEEKETLIGKSIMVEVKQAFGKFVYAEVKPLPKPKA